MANGEAVRSGAQSPIPTILQRDNPLAILQRGIKGLSRYRGKGAVDPLAPTRKREKIEAKASVCLYGDKLNNQRISIEINVNPTKSGSPTKSVCSALSALRHVMIS